MRATGGSRALPSFPTRRSSDLQQRGSDLAQRRHSKFVEAGRGGGIPQGRGREILHDRSIEQRLIKRAMAIGAPPDGIVADRKSTRLNSSHMSISYAVCCLKQK